MLEKRSSLFSSHVVKNQVFVIISVATLGIPSYVAMALAGRNLDANDFGDFVATWSLINTVLLGFFSPIEAQGPRFFSLVSQHHVQFRKQVRSLSKFATLFATITIFAFMLATENSSKFELFLGPFCALSYMYWNEHRTRLFGSSDFKGLAASSALFLVIFSTLVYLASNIQYQDPTFYVACLPLSWLVCSVFFKIGGRFKIQKPSKDHAKPPLENLIPNKIKNYLMLTAGSFISLLPSSLGLILAQDRANTMAELHAYVGTVMISRIVITIANTTTPLASIAYFNKASSQRRNSEIFSIHFLAFAITGITLGIVFFLFGDYLIRIFLGEDSKIVIEIMLLIVLSETLLAATVTTKTRLIAMGISRGQVYPWVASTIVYFVIINFVNGTFGLALGALFAALIVLFRQFFVIKKFNNA